MAENRRVRNEIPLISPEVIMMKCDVPSDADEETENLQEHIFRERIKREILEIKRQLRMRNKELERIKENIEEVRLPNTTQENTQGPREVPSGMILGERLLVRRKGENRRVINHSTEAASTETQSVPFTVLERSTVRRQVERFRCDHCGFRAERLAVLRYHIEQTHVTGQNEQEASGESSTTGFFDLPKRRKERSE